MKFKTIQSFDNQFFCLQNVHFIYDMIISRMSNIWFIKHILRILVKIIKSIYMYLQLAVEYFVSLELYFCE